MLSYNISRHDFSNIVNKNLSNNICNIDAFKNYRRLADLVVLYGNNPNGPTDDCIGIVRNIVCWAEFPACLDNADTTWVIYNL
jgi:hypothetical protein